MGGRVAPHVEVRVTTDQAPGHAWAGDTCCRNCCRSGSRARCGDCCTPGLSHSRCCHRPHQRRSVGFRVGFAGSGSGCRCRRCLHCNIAATLSGRKSPRSGSRTHRSADCARKPEDAGQSATQVWLQQVCPIPQHTLPWPHSTVPPREMQGTQTQEPWLGLPGRAREGAYTLCSRSTPGLPPRCAARGPPGRRRGVCGVAGERRRPWRGGRSGGIESTDPPSASIRHGVVSTMVRAQLVRRSVADAV